MVKTIWQCASNNWHYVKTFKCIKSYEHWLLQKDYIQTIRQKKNMYKQDSVLNNPQWLLCSKPQTKLFKKERNEQWIKH